MPFPGQQDVRIPQMPARRFGIVVAVWLTKHAHAEDHLGFEAHRAAPVIRARGPEPPDPRPCSILAYPAHRKREGLPDGGADHDEPAAARKAAGRNASQVAS